MYIDSGKGVVSISDYFTQLKVFWDELESYRPILPCSCTIPCTCRAVTSIQKHRDEGYVICFLKGMNEKFSSSKSQIMMMTPLPDIDRTFSIVIQQEHKLNPLPSLDFPSDNTIPPTTTSQINYTQYNGGNRHWNPNSRGKTSSSRPNMVCTHCGRTNHTVETCFVKHGYPPGFKKKPRATSFANHISDNPSAGSTNIDFGFTHE